MSSIAILVAISLFASCTKKGAAPAIEPRPSVLRWVTATPPRTSAWTECEAGGCLQHATLTMEGLTRIDIVDGTPRASLQLAESIRKVSAQRFRVVLRPDVKWTNGERLRADHFLTAWNAPRSHLRLKIVSARAVADNAIEFYTATPVSDPGLALAHPSAWPVYAKKGARDYAVTLGPFLLDSTSTTERRLYLRNEGYWGEKPVIAQLRIERVASPLERMELVAAGEADFTDDLADDAVTKLRSNAQLGAYPIPIVTVLAVSPHRRPFSSLKFRELLGEGIAWDELAKQVEPPPRLAESLLPFPGAKPDAWRLREASSDLKGKVKAELEAAGISSAHFVAHLSAPAKLMAVAENLVAQWGKNVGIRVEIGAARAVPDLTLDELEFSVFAPNWGLAAVQTKRAEESLLVPLLRRQRYTLERKTIAGIAWDPRGAWSFRDAHFE